MTDQYDPIYAERVGRYLDARRLECGFSTLKAFGTAAELDPKTISWLVKGRPSTVSGSRFSPRVLHAAESALMLPAGSIETALDTGDLASFERKPRRTPPAPLPVADADELAAISRKLYNILYRLPAGEVARVHLGSAIREVELAIHAYPSTGDVAPDQDPSRDPGQEVSAPDTDGAPS